MNHIINNYLLFIAVYILHIYRSINFCFDFILNEVVDIKFAFILFILNRIL